MLVVLPGLCPAVLTAERLDPAGTRQGALHTGGGITRIPSAVSRV
jgi:hypothetical protein